MSSMQESLGLKHENLELKLRLVELEKQLSVPLSYDPEVLQEQQSQLYQQTQQAAWQVELQQQFLSGPSDSADQGQFTEQGEALPTSAVSTSAQQGEGLSSRDDLQLFSSGSVAACAGGQQEVKRTEPATAAGMSQAAS